MFKIFKVAGTSMSPTFTPGDLVVSCSFFKSFITKNSIVIFFDKYYSFVIKRVSFKNRNYLSLKNDNPNAYSHFCERPLHIKQIEYIALFKLKIKYLRFFINLLKIKY
jgi:phage repressor protein C with HTH and peptisase S24 domain